MKKEQYEFCLTFYKICKRYLKENIEQDKNNDEIDQVKLYKRLKNELEELLNKGNLIKQSNSSVIDDFNEAYDLAEMLHTCIDCIPEKKVYLLRELFIFIKKYKNKIDENKNLIEWQNQIMIEKKDNLYIYNKLRRKIIMFLILMGALTTSALFSQTKTYQKIIDNMNEFFTEEELKLEKKK